MKILYSTKSLRISLFDLDVSDILGSLHRVEYPVSVGRFPCIPEFLLFLIEMEEDRLMENPSPMNSQAELVVLIDSFDLMEKRFGDQLRVSIPLLLFLLCERTRRSIIESANQDTLIILRIESIVNLRIRIIFVNKHGLTIEPGLGMNGESRGVFIELRLSRSQEDNLQKLRKTFLPSLLQIEFDIGIPSVKIQRRSFPA